MNRPEDLPPPQGLEIHGIPGTHSSRCGVCSVARAWGRTPPMVGRRMCADHCLESGHVETPSESRTTFVRCDALPCQIDLLLPLSPEAATNSSDGLFVSRWNSRTRPTAGASSLWQVFTVGSSSWIARSIPESALGAELSHPWKMQGDPSQSRPDPHPPS